MEIMKNMPRNVSNSPQFSHMIIEGKENVTWCCYVGIFENISCKRRTAASINCLCNSAHGRY